MERKETIELLKMVIGVYPDFRLNEKTVDIWDEVFMNENLENVKKNFMEYIKTDRHGRIPTIAQLLRGGYDKR